MSLATSPQTSLTVDLVDSAGSATVVPAAETSTRRPRGRLLGLAAALVVGLLAPLAVNAAPAAAASTYHYRTSWEWRVARYVQVVMNRERHAHGLPSVKMNAQLMHSARSHNYAMSRYNRMSHQLPREPDFGRRMDLSGYHWTYAGENIAWNYTMSTAGAAHLQTTMYNERAPYDGHRRNILSRNFRNVGVDVYLDRRHHKLWLTTDFGNR